MSQRLPQSTQVHQHPAPFRKMERLAMALISGMLLTLLLVAAWLEPSPAGMGTHQQLGLPPCTMNYVLGIRCPGCGMTTAWAHTMNGDLAAGLHCNTSGVLFCLMAISMIPVLGILVYLGRPSRGFWVSRTVLIVVVVIVSVSGIEWLIRLASG